MALNKPSTLAQFLAILDEPIEETTLDREVDKLLAERWEKRRSGEDTQPERNKSIEDDLIERLFDRLAVDYLARRFGLTKKQSAD